MKVKLPQQCQRAFKCHMLYVGIEGSRLKINSIFSIDLYHHHQWPHEAWSQLLPAFSSVILLIPVLIYVLNVFMKDTRGICNTADMRWNWNGSFDLFVCINLNNFPSYSWVEWPLKRFEFDSKPLNASSNTVSSLLTYYHQLHLCNWRICSLVVFLNRPFTIGGADRPVQLIEKI